MNKTNISTNVKRTSLIVDNNATIADILAQAGMNTGFGWNLNGEILDMNEQSQTLHDLGVDDETEIWLTKIVKADNAWN